MTSKEPEAPPSTRSASEPEEASGTSEATEIAALSREPSRSPEPRADDQGEEARAEAEKDRPARQGRAAKRASSGPSAKDQKKRRTKGTVEPKEADEDEAEPRKARPDVPSFALDFPSDPTLDKLVLTFEQGNYSRVRHEAKALAKSADRPEVRRAAQELGRRVDPDPLAVYLLAIAALLLTFLAFWYWSHPHEGAGP